MEAINTYTIPAKVGLAVLESLRLAHIYALKDSHPEELPADFKPEKWEGYEVEFAETSFANYKAMLKACTESSHCINEMLLEAFRTEVCSRPSEVDEAEELDWHALSIGFFLARGASTEQAHELARTARYTHQYWL